MSVLNYKEMVTKNHLLYAFSDEIEEKISSHNLVTSAKFSEFEEKGAFHNSLISNRI